LISGYCRGGAAGVDYLVMNCKKVVEWVSRELEWSGYYGLAIL